MPVFFIHVLQRLQDNSIHVHIPNIVSLQQQVFDDVVSDIGHVVEIGRAEIGALLLNVVVFYQLHWIIQIF
jgi:hypothetical protein